MSRLFRIFASRSDTGWSDEMCGAGRLISHRMNRGGGASNGQNEIASASASPFAIISTRLRATTLRKSLL